MSKNLITTDGYRMEGLGKEHIFTCNDDPIRFNLIQEVKSKRGADFTICSDDLWISIAPSSTKEDIDIYFDPKKLLFEIGSFPCQRIPSIWIEGGLTNVFHILGYFVSDTGFQLKLSKDGLTISLDRKYLYTVYKEDPLVDFTFFPGYPYFQVFKLRKGPDVGMCSYPPIGASFNYHLNPENNKAVRGFEISPDTIFPGVPIYSHLDAGYKDWETLHILPTRNEKDVLSVSSKWESFLEWDLDTYWYDTSNYGSRYYYIEGHEKGVTNCQKS